MNTHTKNILLLIGTVIVLVYIYNIFNDRIDQTKGQLIPYTSFQQAVVDKQVTGVIMKRNMIEGKKIDGTSFITQVPEHTDVANALSQQGVQVEAVTVDDGKPSFWAIFLSFGPYLLLIGLMFYSYRQMQAGSGKTFGFGKSKAKLLMDSATKVTFKDVAGVDEAKEEVQEIIEFLKDPQKFQRLGGKIPKGVLLIGPPGTGKTLLAKAIAGEASVPFFSISGSDFVEMFVGVGASRVRDMFEQARKNVPCILFIDEIDAVGRHRGAGMGGGNDEREQTLNQLLVEMDGFSSSETIILIAATNRPDVLDSALLRPGRFDRQVVVPLPDVKGRQQILNVHLKKITTASDLDALTLAKGTPGFSGAELASLVNESALLAARKGRRFVSMTELEEAKDKVMMGAERRSQVMSEKEKKVTAYHEAGHALVACSLKDADPIHKATIIPRGRALGMVMRLPSSEISRSLAQYKSDLAIALGGRIAEEKIFGWENITSGASSDIEMASRLARSMITQWGFSKKLGLLSYGAPEREVFLGHAVTQTQTISSATMKEVDVEVRTLIDEAHKKATSILTKNAKALERIAQALLEFETITGEEIHALIKGKKIDRPTPKAPRKPKTSSLPASKEKAVEELPILPEPTEPSEIPA
ncbi:MAG: ATP-dependent zinc metalloprotease FtsH [Alphaproteobacteria bacterium]